MRIDRQHFGTSFAVMLILALAILLIGDQLNFAQQDAIQNGKEITQQNPGPIIDSSDMSTDSPKEANRRASHNREAQQPIEELHGDVTRLPENRDAIGGHNPLPVNTSDAILIGRVDRSAAHFSSDRTGVFSTFEVSVTKVLSTDKLTESIQDGSTIVIERDGGRVRYPSGKIESLSVYGRNMPDVNSTYLFFVKESPGAKPWTPTNDEGLDLLTGYELKDGKVYALDRAPRPGLLLYEKFDGTAEGDLIQMVESLVQKRCDTTAGGGCL